MANYSTASSEEKLLDENSSWSVYLLRCGDHSLYTGVTANLRRRLRQHNGELAGGARYTQSRRPVAVVWVMAAADRSAAQRLEARLKRLSKGDKEKLIRGTELSALLGEPLDGK